MPGAATTEAVAMVETAVEEVGKFNGTVQEAVTDCLVSLASTIDSSFISPSSIESYCSEASIKLS